MSERKYQGYLWIRSGITVLLFGAILGALGLPLYFIAMWRTIGALPAIQWTIAGAAAVFLLLLLSEVMRLLLDLEARLRRIEAAPAPPETGRGRGPLQ